ncbi:MAG: GNAT family N-acetyltransferase [Chloroflexota bacterium]
MQPLLRGRGLGSQIFAAVCGWAQHQGCRQLKVETQNTNVHACRFYAHQGCELRAVRPDAYPEFPDEVELLCYRDL